MNPIKKFWNWRQPNNTAWVPYVLVIVAVIVLVNVISR